MVDKDKPLKDAITRVFRTFGLPCHGNHGPIHLVDLGYTGVDPDATREYDLVAVARKHYGHYFISRKTFWI